MASDPTPSSETKSYPPTCEPEDEVFTVFSTTEKRLIVALMGVSMLFSPLTANIYFPAIDRLAEDLHTSVQNINLTITAYLVFQAVSPVLFGDVADVIGRRPVFVAMFSIYVAANLSLALQNSFTALLILRMVQSLGCSATVAVSYGVFADIATAADRGGMVGSAMIATNLGPPLAPLIGGALLSRLGWRWLFWFLLLCGGTFLVTIILFLPETARNIVGNGKDIPRPWRRPYVSLICGLNIPKDGRINTGEAPHKRKTTIPNPLRSIRVIFYKDSSLVLAISGIFYMIYYCLQTSLATLFRQQYQFGDTIIGTCYLSIGFGVIAGGYCNGLLLDRSYLVTAKEAGFESTGKKSHDISKFPIEKARLRAMLYIQVLHIAAMVGYGWMFNNHVHFSGPLIIQFILGFLQTCIVQTFNTLLVDIFQENPSAAAASGNIVRCGLSAAGIAAMDPLMSLISPGWYFTFLGLVGGFGGLVGTMVLLKMGMKWRAGRHNR